MNEMKGNTLRSSSPTQIDQPIPPADSIPMRGPHSSVQPKTMPGMRRYLWLALASVVGLPVIYWSYNVWSHHSLTALAMKCQEYSEESQWDQLARESERWSKREPDLAEPWLYRAEAAEGLQDWKLVAECLGRVPKSDSRAIPSLARKAGLEFENLNQPWEGLRTCDEILQLDSRVLLAHKQSIFFDAMTLQRSEMIRRIRAAIRVRRESPDSYVYLAGASWFYGSSLYRHNTHWLKNHPEDETFQVARAMQIYMSEAKGNLEEAAKYDHIPAAQELLKRYPHNVELIAYFVDLAMEDGDIARVDQLLAAVPAEHVAKDARVWRARAWKADLSGDLPRAEEFLRQAHSIDPYWWKVHFQLYDVLRRLGRSEDSKRFLQIYDVSMALSKTIMEMNRSTEAFDDLKFREALLVLAELVDDHEVIASLRERLHTS